MIWGVWLRACSIPLWSQFPSGHPGRGLWWLLLALLVARLQLGLGLPTLVPMHLSCPGSPYHLSLNCSPPEKRSGSLPGLSQVALTRTLAWMENSPEDGGCVISSFQQGGYWAGAGKVARPLLRPSSSSCPQLRQRLCSG